jgi:hypothetical protein
MPEGCLDKSCLGCESHAIVGGKIDCNYMNRLGLAQPTVKSFLKEEAPSRTTEDLEAELRQMDAQQELMNQKKTELEALKKKTEGVTSASLS